MSSPYTNISVIGFNANAPSDDGSEVASNSVEWQKHVDKLAEPLKTAIEAINTNVDAAFVSILGITDAESTEGVVPVNFKFEPGHLYRYATNTTPGTTDMTTALTNAFAVADRIIIPGDRISLDNSAEITLSASGRTVVCEEGATLELSDNAMGIVITGTDIKWRGGHLKGEGTVNNDSSVRKRSCLLIDRSASPAEYANISIRGLKCTEANNTAIGVYRAVGVEINDNYAEDDSGDAGTSRIGLYAADSAHIKFTGNTVDGFGQGIGGGGDSGAFTFDSLDGITGSGLQRSIIVTSNQCYNQADHGIYFSDNMEGYIVSDNDVINTDGASNTIKLQGDFVVCSGNRTRGLRGIHLRAARQQICTDNVVEVTDTGEFITGLTMQSLDSFDYDYHDIIIKANIFKSTNSTGAWHGIFVHARADGSPNIFESLQRVLIQGNIIEGFFGKLGARSSGINVRVGEDDTTTESQDQISILDNIISLDDTHTTANNGVNCLFNGQDVLIRGNQIRGVSGDCVDIEGIDTAIISDNILAGNASASGTVGIKGESDCANIKLGINHFRDVDTKISIPSSVEHGQAHVALRAGTTWNPASIADGDHEELDITVTGADPGGDIAVAQFSVDTVGLVLSATVTAADTVTAVLANNTGGAVNLASGTLYVAVLKRDF